MYMYFHGISNTPSTVEIDMYMYMYMYSSWVQYRTNLRY